MEPPGGIHHRRALHAGLAGPMLEVGAGNGLTFANYSPVVTDALAVAPEPYPRALARAAAAQARGCMRQPLISAALALHAHPDSPEGGAIQWPGRPCRPTRPGGRR